MRCARAGTSSSRAFPEELLDRLVFRHGFVGLMGLPDTLGFMQAHLDHHARQVERRSTRS